MHYSIQLICSHITSPEASDHIMHEDSEDSMGNYTKTNILLMLIKKKEDENINENICEDELYVCDAYETKK